MDVGVRELKARLAEYLDRAAQGEVIRVTDRGKPKATLGPLPGRLRLDEGVSEGWVTPAEHQGLGVGGRRYETRSSVAEALGEDRGR